MKHPKDTILDKFDIQGIILKDYNKLGYIKARYLFFQFNNGDHARNFIDDMDEIVTTGAPWKTDSTNPDAIDWPDSTTNIAFTFSGLQRLGVPIKVLQTFPDEFIIGMRDRGEILGDNDASSPEYWDKIWNERIDMFVSINATNDEELVTRYNEIVRMSDAYEGVILLDGHANPYEDGTLKYQTASVLFDGEGLPTPKEHFGYTDGISNPFFKGMNEEEGELIGGGKKSNYKSDGYGDPTKESSWMPLETGEFILGYKDEAEEWPEAPFPPLMSRNGSFMVYRKLHENVKSFEDYVEAKSKVYAGSKEELYAKLAGRWRNGLPITKFPDEKAADKIAKRRQTILGKLSMRLENEEKAMLLKELKEINKLFTGFDYNDDLDGSKCPIGAHTRRTNPRGSLEHGEKDAFATPSALTDRRRIIRRGKPYGITQNNDDGEHGIIFMTIQASIKRQFEFVQQQWINYGNDFKLSNDKDGLLGNHKATEGRMVIPGDAKKGRCPHFMNEMPRFVETRGGEYFFIPSMTSLRMLAKGIIDPT